MRILNEGGDYSERRDGVKQKWMASALMKTSETGYHERGLGTAIGPTKGAQKATVMETARPRQWSYLVPNPKSYLRQLFIKGTEFPARDLYVLFVDDEEPMTKQEIADAYGVPLGAVEEAIAYAESDPPEIRQDIADSDAWFAARGLDEATSATNPAPNNHQGPIRP